MNLTSFNQGRKYWFYVKKGQQFENAYYFLKGFKLLESMFLQIAIVVAQFMQVHEKNVYGEI